MSSNGRQRAGTHSWLFLTFYVFYLQIEEFLLVGLPGLEPGTSSLSEKRSNRLSYRPFGGFAKNYEACDRDNVQHAQFLGKEIEGSGVSK